MRKAKVFLSSVFRELEPFRAAAAEGIERAGHDCILMENIASADPPEVACAREVQTCDLFLLLIGITYGSCPEDGEKLSYTQREFAASVARNIPRLVFNGDPDDFRVPLSVVEELARYGLPEQVQRVNQLREAARVNCTPTYFSDPEDLRRKVEDSVRRHFNAHPLPEPPEQPKPDETANPLSHLVLKLCDRSAQDLDFKIHFDLASDVCPGRPLIYVLHGPKDQRHEYCVRALIWRHLEKERVSSGVVFRPAPLEKKFVLWPGSEPLVSSMYRRLIASLMETVNRDARITALTAQRFCEIASGESAVNLVLRHPIPAWDAVTERLLQDYYLPFWDEVSEYCASDKGKAMPRILVFFEVHYERPTEVLARRPPAVASFFRRFFQRDATPTPTTIDVSTRIQTVFGSTERKLDAAERARRCVIEVLAPLPDVAESDYNVWIKRYADVLPASVCRLNFTREFGQAVSMERFEDRVQKEFGRK